MEETNNLPVLSTEELRVLGSLLEKSKTTPEYYPMTLNSRPRVTKRLRENPLFLMTKTRLSRLWIRYEKEG